MSDCGYLKWPCSSRPNGKIQIALKIYHISKTKVKDEGLASPREQPEETVQALSSARAEEVDYGGDGSNFPSWIWSFCHMIYDATKLEIRRNENRAPDAQ